MLNVLKHGNINALVDREVVDETKRENGKKKEGKYHKEPSLSY